MNSKQRVLTALNNGQPDKVPICDWIDRPTVLNLAAYLGLDSREAGAGGSSLWGPEGFESLDLLCLLIEELGDEPSHYEIFAAIRTGDPVHAAEVLRAHINAAGAALLIRMEEVDRQGVSLQEV